MRIDVLDVTGDRGTAGQVQANKQVLVMEERGQVVPEVRKMGVKGPCFKPQMEGVKRTLRVSNPLVRECLGELIGTFVLLMFGCSASAQVKTSREAKGQYLSANMAFSVGVMSAMYLCKGVSGAHLNPAVTLSLCSLGRVPWVKLLPYSLCQVLGAYLASGLVFLVYYGAIMDFSGGNLTVYGANETASIFATYPAEHLSLRSSILDQVVGTAMLMLCILPLDDQKNSPAPDALIPPIVAVVVLGIGMSMSSNCGGAINPARDLGPRLLTLTAGWGTEVFTCYNYWFWVPLTAPLLGGMVGSGMYLVFIAWHLPDLPTTPPIDSPSTKPTVEVWKQPPAPEKGGVELKTAVF